MKKLNQLTVVILALGIAGFAQGVGIGSQPAQQQPPAQQPPAQSTTTTTQAPGQTTTTTQAPGQTTTTTTSQQPAAAPVIKDPAEYNSYMAAIGMQNPAQKAAALEQFLQQYPNTAVKKDALQQLLGAYQQAGNMQKATEAANNLLQVDPSNVYALFVEAFNNLSCAQTQANAQCAANASKYGQQGLQALSSFAKPQGMTEDQYDKLKTAMTGTFNTAAGFGALQQKDFPTAQKYLGAAVEAAPNDVAVVYPLATAYLAQKPLNPLGFWYGARAIDLAPNPQAKAQIQKYVQTTYDNYHGSDDGFAQLLQQAQASPNPPNPFNVTQMTPAVQAQNIYNQGGGDCKKLDLGSWEFIFENADQQLADKCMADIKANAFAFQAKVIQSSAERLMLAATEDDINSNTADADVTMAAAIPAKLIPKPGSTAKIQAVPVSYDKQPYMLHMNTGKFVATRPAARHTTTHRRRRPSSQ
jgi:tetratricopeptide (TPR) repeat protein